MSIENSIPVKNSIPFLAEPNERAESLQAAKHEPPAVSLDEHGMITDCSKSFEKLVGFRRSELAWQHVSMVFPELKDVDLFRDGQINPMLSYLSRCGQPYLVQNRRGETFTGRLNYVCIDNGGKRTLRLIVRS